MNSFRKHNGDLAKHGFYPFTRNRNNVIRADVYLFDDFSNVEKQIIDQLIPKW